MQGGTFGCRYLRRVAQGAVGGGQGLPAPGPPRTKKREAGDPASLNKFLEL